MRVILINPWDQSVSEAEYSGELRDCYRLLSGPTIEGQPDAQIGVTARFVRQTTIWRT